MASAGRAGIRPGRCWSSWRTAGIGLPPVSLAGRDLRLSATLFTTLPGMHDVALPSIVVPVADPVTPDRPTIRARCARRATDQPTIVVDPVTGVSYANYPDQPHDVSGIQGSLLIEGGALDKPDYDGALRAGVGLPGETDAPLGARNTGQAPTAAANNRIRLFDDGTLTGQVGMQDMAAQLSGLGRLQQPAGGRLRPHHRTGHDAGRGRGGGQHLPGQRSWHPWL